MNVANKFNKFTILFSTLIAICSCTNSEINPDNVKNFNSSVSSPEDIENRYYKLFKSVDASVNLPSFSVHIGSQGEDSISLLAFINEPTLDFSERDWALSCENGLEVEVIEEVFDPIFNVGRVSIIGHNDALSSQNCELRLNALKAGTIFPELKQDNEFFSFTAFSCNEPYTTKRNGILARDISLWRRLEQRALGEDTKDEALPHSPSFTLGLGDQIYVDPDPNEENALSILTGSKSDQWLIENSTDSLYSIFKTIYRYNFLSPHVADTFSKMPSLMMWDDHEIRDGWGSHGDEQDEDKQRLFKIARHAFIANQYLRNIEPGGIDQEKYDELLSSSKPLHHGFSFGNRVHFLMLDSRTNRSLNDSSSLFDASTNNAVDSWLAKGNNESGNLYVLTSGTPLFASRFIDESFIATLDIEIRDDMIDAWGSYHNTLARDELLERLKKHFTANPKDRLLVMSGDVHYSSLYQIKLDGQIIGQEIVTSGIAHSLPSPVMTINTLIERTKSVGGFDIIPSGKINHSASFSEVVVNTSDLYETPQVSTVFHANGTKVNADVDWVLANTQLIQDHSNIKPLWYHQYNFADFQINEHLSNVPSGVIPAGSIANLPFRTEFELKVRWWEPIAQFFWPRRKPTILSDIQAQSVFCSVAGIDYNKGLATDWNLENLSKSCVPLKR